MTYGGLVSFGDYSFANLDKYRDTFSQAQPQTVQFPGMDGGWNADGAGGPVAGPGAVTLGITLVASSRGEMDDLRDAVNALRYLGEQRLIYQPTDATASERWTWATVDRIQMDQDKGRHTDLWQPVTLTFSCPEPVWWVDIGDSWTIGDGSLVGDTGLVIGGGGVTLAASGLSTTTTIPNNGNVPYVPEIVVQPTVGNSCEDVIIQRKEGSLIVDEVRYSGILGATDVLTLNGRTQRVDVNGASAWGNIAYIHPSLFRLVPGSNSIQVVFTHSGDAANVIFYYRHAYR